MSSNGKEKNKVFDIPPLLFPDLPATSNSFSAQGISYTLFCSLRWVCPPSAFPVSPWSLSASFLHPKCSPARRSATACVNCCHCCVVLNQAPVSFRWCLPVLVSGEAGSSQSPPSRWAWWKVVSPTGCSIPVALLVLVRQLLQTLIILLAFLWSFSRGFFSLLFRTEDFLSLFSVCSWGVVFALQSN